MPPKALSGLELVTSTKVISAETFIGALVAALPVPEVARQLRSDSAVLEVLTCHRLSPDYDPDLTSDWLAAVLTHGHPRGHHRWLAWDCPTATKHLGSSAAHRLAGCAHAALMALPSVSGLQAVWRALIAEQPLHQGVLRAFRQLPLLQQTLLCMGAHLLFAPPVLIHAFCTRSGSCRCCSRRCSAWVRTFCPPVLWR